MQLPELPPWLPPAVSQWLKDGYNNYIKHAQDSSHSIEGSFWSVDVLRSRLLRLIKCKEMKSVWTQLAHAKFKSESGAGIEQRGAFLRGYAFLAVYPGTPSTFWESMLPLEEQRARLKEISRLAKKLQRNLGPLLPFEGKTTQYTAWDTLNAGVSKLEPGDLRDKLLALQNNVRGLAWNGGENEVAHILDVRVPFVFLPDQLAALQELADFTDKSPLTKPPKGTKRYQTMYIRRLADYVHTHLDKPFNQAIATTVSIALDLKIRLSESYVRGCLRKRIRSDESP